MPIECVMLDSGAFSVWSKGATIDLDKYIAFCLSHPNIDYYVNLDVIPKDGSDLDECCEQGWINYQRMIEKLPKEKVIPVYHQGEDAGWLGRYLDLGCPYIGISPKTKCHTKKILVWIREIRKLLRDDVRFHGFGVGSQDLMRCYPWHSVDSRTWLLHASSWQILVPKTTKGEWDYSKPPTVIRLSPRKSPTRLTPILRGLVLKYLEENGMTLGRCVVEDYEGGALGEDCYWLDKTKKRIVRGVEKGVITSNLMRSILNIRYFVKQSACLGVKVFYTAGISSELIREFPDVINPLLSFHASKVDDILGGGK